MKKILIGLIFSLFFTFTYAEEVVVVEETVVDNAPVITLRGDEIVSINVGETYIDQGATALDDIDGEISTSVTVTNDLNIDLPGTYYFTYTVTDSGNNKTEVKRQVNVLEVATSPKLVSISITTQATKLNYYTGEALDISGLVVTGTYDDSSTKIEEIKLENISGFNSDTSQTGQEIKITLGGFETIYLINVIEKPKEESEDNKVSGSIILNDSCSITDLNGDTHEFSGSYLGICALSKAKTENIINNFEIIEYPFGLFIDSINGIKDPMSSYWALYLNDEYEMRGVTTLPLAKGDKVSFVYLNFSDVELGPRVDIMISELSSSQSGGGGSSNNEEVSSFSVDNAISFLLANHQNDMDIMYTDWVAIGTGLQSNSIKNKIKSFYQSDDFDLLSITDYERHALAGMAVGINPYDNGTIEKIISSFDGKQIGEKNLLNDDIFGLIVLSKAGYRKNDEIIKAVVSHLVDKQGSDGSFESVDMTAAAIQALSLFKSLSGDAIPKAENYLLSQQKEDGSFGNVYSTSWAVQALSINERESEEVNKAIKYLSSLQKEDGGLLDDLIENRIWSTSYAIPAILGLTFADQVEDFDKPQEEEDNFTNTTDVSTQNKIEIIEEETVVQEEVPIELEVPEIVTKMIPKEVVTVKKEIKPVFTETASNPLNASVVNSISQSNNSQFFDSVSNVLSKIRGFFIKFWHMLGF